MCRLAYDIPNLCHVLQSFLSLIDNNYDPSFKQ